MIGIVYSGVRICSPSDSCSQLLRILFRPSLAIAEAPRNSVKSGSAAAQSEGSGFTDPSVAQRGH